MLTQEYVKKLFIYDPETGLFIRLTMSSKAVKIGEIAGYHVKSSGKTYVSIGIGGIYYKAHRLAFLYMNGSLPIDHVDHINGNGTDNRWCNLREVNRTINNQNARKRIDNKSGITGVSWETRDNHWRVEINVNRKKIVLGYFDNIFDAACARKNANIKYGFHKNHGSERSL